MDNKIKSYSASDPTAQRSNRRFIAGLIVLCTVCALALPSCKQNNWMDWKTQNDLWLKNNKTQPGVIELSSGLQYKIIADPTPQDARPNTTSTVVCDYTVTLINGYQIQGGNNVTLYLPNTIPGFAEGCHMIHNNGDIEFYIPAYLGYDYEKYVTDSYYDAEGSGTEGTQGYIPPYSTLIYTVHLCAVSGE